MILTAPNGIAYDVDPTSPWNADPDGIDRTGDERFPEMRTADIIVFPPRGRFSCQKTVDKGDA